MPRHSKALCPVSVFPDRALTALCPVSVFLDRALTAWALSQTMLMTVAASYRAKDRVRPLNFILSTVLRANLVLAHPVLILTNPG